MDMKKLLIFSAFPQELRHVLKNVRIVGRARMSPFDIFVSRYASCEAILVLTGVEVRNADSSLRLVLEQYRPDIVVSCGFGGALYDGAAIGDLVYGTSVFLVGEGLAEKLELPFAGGVITEMRGGVPVYEGNILTLKRWRKKADIRKVLPPGVAFPICDMETFYLARLSGEEGVPFIAVRSITDRADEEISADFLAVSDESGRYALFRAVGLILRKPWLVPEAVRLGIRSNIASRNLWRFVKGLIEAG